MLMERSASYRRALAPAALATGTVGLLACGIGWYCQIDTGQSFAVFWLTVAGLAFFLSVAIVRRQALRRMEPFWSLPTRRVAEAIFPALTVGLMSGLLGAVPVFPTPEFAWRLPSIWMTLYGLGLFSAGFFMPRGIRLFGLGFVVMGMATLWGFPHVPAEPTNAAVELRAAHLVMGGSFGLLHLFYGWYLLLTESHSPS